MSVALDDAGPGYESLARFADGRRGNVHPPNRWSDVLHSTVVRRRRSAACSGWAG